MTQRSSPALYRGRGMLLIVFSQGSGGFSELAKRWTDIRRAVLAGLDAVNSRGLEYGAGGHYSSLYALAVLWTWRYLAFQWEAQHGLNVPRRDDFDKKLTATLSSVLDRWLICSQWAGRWAGSSAPIIAGYAKGLHEGFHTCAKLELWRASTRS